MKRDGHLVVRLHPIKKKGDKSDYKSHVVELEGKDPDSKWINAKLDYGEQDSPKAVICVNNTPAGTYEYRVIIDGIGTIDPRVDVEE